MSFLLALVLLFSFESFSQSKKPWSVSLGHNYSRSLSYSSPTTLSQSFGFSYTFKKKSISLSTSYFKPLVSFVSDPSHGLTDTSLVLNMDFPFFSSFMKNFFNMESGNSIGVTLPTSLTARRAGKYASLFVIFNYSKALSYFKLNFEHIFYSGLYRYRTNLSGIANRLASTSHSASLTWLFNKISFSGKFRFYLYSYLADLNPDPEITETKIKFKGGQGGSVTLSYNLPYSIVAYGQSSLNIPVVSTILTGFPLFDHKNISYSLGMNWKF